MTNFRVSDDVKLGYIPERIAECWEAMEELVAKGLVKAIGISNFSITKMEQLLKTAKIVPAVNQIECHPYFQQLKLVEYCKSKGIVVGAHSSLGRPGIPDSYTAGVPAVIEDPSGDQDSCEALSYTSPGRPSTIMPLTAVVVTCILTVPAIYLYR